MSTETSEKVDKVEVENFLRNVPNPALVSVSAEDCDVCKDMAEELQKLELPKENAFINITLDSQNPNDLEIAEMLGVDGVPAVIAFCHGTEVGRASSPEEVGDLVEALKNCGVESCNNDIDTDTADDPSALNLP